MHGPLPVNVIYDQLLFFPHCLICGCVKRRVFINVKGCPYEVYNVRSRLHVRESGQVELYTFCIAIYLWVVTVLKDK